MENNQVILLKLNRFLFFTDQQFPILPSSSNHLLGSFSSFFTAIPDFFISICTAIFNFVSSIFTSVSNFFTSIPNVFSSIFTAISSLFTSISNFFTSIPNFFTSIFSVISSFFTSIPGLFSSIFTSISNFFISIFHHIGQFFTAIPNFFIAILRKLDEAVPPETRIRILTITSACVAAIILLIVLYYFFPVIISCTSCVGGACMTVITPIFTWLYGVCSGCCWSAAGVLMKAPGTAGLLISRALFEGASQAYFAAQRAGQLVVCCGRVVFFPGAI